MLDDDKMIAIKENTKDITSALLRLRIMKEYWLNDFESLQVRLDIGNNKNVTMITRNVIKGSVSTSIANWPLKILYVTIKYRIPNE